ncbi:hypothetical protein M422DRAFT_34673 [Sphaerobolus stellatus SS14]|uniref:Uncharacterized protein n=1 Tax=Sphaerobolus stellatus (strain SS14) TaxID=990650 RepID=A0A0C9VCX9_SPHS4|nr:hypothetical protein M422DRAFT_34673 [Sphaerobolus stellatus SS14]
MDHMYLTLTIKLKSKEPFAYPSMHPHREPEPEPAGSALIWHYCIFQMGTRGRTTYANLQLGSRDGDSDSNPTSSDAPVAGPSLASDGIGPSCSVRVDGEGQGAGLTTLNIERLNIDIGSSDVGRSSCKSTIKISGLWIYGACSLFGNPHPHPAMSPINT